MKIYRGHIGVEMSLEEFYSVLGEPEGMEQILDTIYELENDEAMQWREEDIAEYEEGLMREIEEKQKKNKESSERVRIERALRMINDNGI